MYTVGLQSAADAFLLSSLQVQVFLALCILFVLLLFGLDTNSGQNASHSPVFLPGSHLLAIAPFFQRRFEFLNDGFRKTGQSLFQFNMLRARPPFASVRVQLLTSSQETVIVVSGETGRKAFFSNRAFDLTEGFKVLSGAVRHTPSPGFVLTPPQIPVLSGITSDLQARTVTHIHKRLQSAQREDHLAQRMLTVSTATSPLTLVCSHRPHPQRLSQCHGIVGRVGNHRPL